MATKPKQGNADIIEDGRRVFASFKKYKAKFAKADEARQKKHVPAALVTRLTKNLAEAAGAVRSHAAKTLSASSATRREESARAKLFALVTAVRDDIKLAYEDQPGIDRAFGVGARIDENSTPSLTKAANGVVAAYAVKENAAAAKLAGVTKARINAVSRAAEALTGADTEQGKNIGARKGATEAKSALIASIKKDTAHIRKVAAALFRTAPEVKKEFESTVGRRTPKKRPASTAAKPQTPS